MERGRLFIATSLAVTFLVISTSLYFWHGQDHELSRQPSVSSQGVSQDYPEIEDQWEPLEARGIGGYIVQDGSVFWKEYRDWNRSYRSHNLHIDADDFFVSTINPDVARTRESVFFTNAVVKGADPNSVKILSYDFRTGAGYFKDKSFVYWGLYVHSAYDGIVVVRGADVSSFRLVRGNPAYDAEDKRHRYVRGRLLSEALPSL